ncbi:hypothetical protein [Microbacterium invictum]|uniref:Lipoprotein n=1 Tax=Microbacterium invictum TaxID=515415 RepID=A0AA40VLW3_9MICO|nr:MULTISPECIES: hypothetical protein [Microbacterium]MBB4139799.1 hypothetical protein [Microbacterium invictum]
MKGHLVAFAASVPLLLLLSGCAAQPSVDLDGAREWVETVQAEESDGPGAAGTASMLIDSEPADDEGIRLDFAAPTQLVRADARCFGGGTADVTVTVFSADGTESDTFDGEIPCDEAAHSIDIDFDPASAALIQAQGSTQTYLHVTVIQEMVVER